MQNALPQKQATDRLFGWWYYLTAPANVPADASLQQRAAVRRGKLASVIILFEILYHISVLGVGATSNPQLIPILIISLSVLTLAAIFNRFGKVSVAGVLSVGILEAGMFFNLTSLSLLAGGLSTFDLPLYDILVIPTLIAISLFPQWITFSVAGLNCLFVVGTIILFPKTPEMAQALISAPYDTWFRPVSIQFVAALVCYFWVSNAFQAMKRADLAEEVNKLAQALATQQRVVLQEKQQLEESIQKIVNVHTQVANGNFTARVPLNQNNVLWSIAGSLNNLLARLQRWRRDSIQLQRTEHAIQQSIYVIQLAKKQNRPLPAYKTGTALDPLITEIVTEKSTLRASSGPLMSSPNRLASSSGSGQFTPSPDLFAPSSGPLFSPPDQFSPSAGQFISPPDQFSPSAGQFIPPPDRPLHFRRFSD